MVVSGKVTRKEAEEIFLKWQESKKALIGKLTDSEQIKRDRLLKIEESVRNEVDGKGTANYQFDLKFVIELYYYFTFELGVSTREASNDDFWRYVSMKLIPDIVERRWEGLKSSRFYKEPRRIWVKALWWYIHLSWQGSKEETYRILKHNTTDTIVQLVERPGFGYRISFTRELMKHFGCLAEEEPDKHNTETFRKIMRLNTARSKVVEPALFGGGEQEYIKELFEYFNEKDRAIQRS